MLNRRRSLGARTACAVAATFVAAAVLACGRSDDPDSSAAPDAPQPFVANAVHSDAPNRRPVVEDARFVPEVLQPGVGLQVLPRAKDPDGDPIHFDYVWEVEGLRSTAHGPRLEVPQMTRGESIRVTITPRDDEGTGDPYVAEITMGNRLPRMQELRIETVERDGQPGWQLEPIAFDADGDALDYDISWLVNGELRADKTDWFSKEGVKRGDEVRVRAIARDSYGASPPLDSAPLVIGNHAPRIHSEPPGLGPGGVFRYAVEASDPDGDRDLVFSLERGPKGMTIDATSGLTEWTPTAESAGDHEVEIDVSDGHGGIAKQMFEVSVQISRGGSSPASPADRP